MQNLNTENIESILDNLKDEMSIEPMVHKMFEFKEPQEVKQLIEKLKGSLAKKNNELKKLLSNNHQHLFSCTDLIDQLKKFSKSAKLNQGKLEILQNSADKFDGDVEVESEELDVPKFEIDEMKAKLWIEGWFGSKRAVGLADVKMMVLYEDSFGSGDGGVTQSVFRRLIDGMYGQFCYNGDSSGDVENVIESLCCAIFSKEGASLDNLTELVETVVYLSCQKSQNFEISNEKFESIFNNVGTIFDCFIKSIEIIYLSMIQSDSWKFDLVKLVKSFGLIETGFGKVFKLGNNEKLENLDLNFFLRGECNLQNIGEIIQSSDGEGYLPLLRDSFLMVYKEAIKRSVSFGVLSKEQSTSEIFKDYQDNIEFINNWENSLEGKLLEEEKLKIVLVNSWNDHCERIIKELENSVSLDNLFSEVFMAEKDQMTAVIHGYSANLLNNYNALEGLNKLNSENLDYLRFENKKNSFVKNFQKFFFESYTHFLENNIEKMKVDFADDEILKVITVIIEVVEAIKATDFDKDQLDSLKQSSLELFWKKGDDLIHKVKEMNKYCEIYKIGQNIAKILLVDGLRILSSDASSFESALLAFIEQKLESDNKHMDTIRDLRASCRRIIPFYILPGEAYNVEKDPSFTFKKRQVTSLRKVDYLKHILI